MCAVVDVTHRMMLLAVQFGIIILAARAGSLLFRRLRLPGALGELIVGIVIGPYALGKLALPGFADGVFGAVHGVGVSPELQAIAAIAAIVLMFDVGLETDLKLLLKYSLAGGVVGVGGMVVSFFAGCASVKLFAMTLFGNSIDLFAPPCLFVGAITTATSIGITARILSERKKLDSPEGVTILTAAVLDDVMGIIILAIITGIVSAGNSGGSISWSSVGWLSAKTIGIWIGATTIGLLGSKLISKILKQSRDWNNITVMALALALILAGLFEQAGLAMIVGAFVMGLSLSRSDISHVIREKLVTIRVLLVPAFFCVAGMKIDISVLKDPDILLFGLVFALVAMGAKVVGCGLPALLVNFNLTGALRVGFGMSPRCEVALIVAGIGSTYQWEGKPLLSSGIFAAIIIMILINTIVAPPILSSLFKNRRSGTRKGVEDDKDQINLDFEFPSDEMASFFIRKLIVVFEQEGFFVHRVNRAQQLFHLRKDQTVIQFTRNDNCLSFTCYDDDVMLVRIAVNEAMAAFEQAIKNMKKPMDARSIARIESRADNARLMPGIGRYLTADLVEPQLKGETKEQIILELLDILKRASLIENIESARKAVFDREQSMSTGLEHGIAIPHARTDGVSRLVCAVGIKSEGIDFDSFDKQPSKIFIITLSPESQPAPHIQFMSDVNRILDENGRRAVLAGGTAQEICDVFAGTRKIRLAKNAGFSLSRFVSPELVNLNLQGSTPDQIIGELVDMVADSGKIRNRQKAMQVVLDREHQMSTAMEEGVALPHGRTDEVRSLVCAIGIKPEGLDFGAVDGKPSNIFVLVLTPTRGADPYLQFIAALMAKLDGEGRKVILQAKCARDVAEHFS